MKTRYYERFYEGEKIPRKAKKQILGLLPTRRALKERIERVKFETIKPFNNNYNYLYPDDDFCPYCGCEHSRSAGNLACYPEEWIKFYCHRCNKMVSYRDNGLVWHALMDFKPEESEGTL